MALNFYVTIEGARTGTFKGESRRSGRQNQIEGLAFHYGVSMPRDPETGAATGRAQRELVTMTKAWGAASPQLYQALINNEALKSVLFEFYRTDSTGAEAVFQRITLGSAGVASINQHIEPTYDPARQKYPELEEISFVFGRIEVDNVPGSTSVVDDWEQR